MKRLNKTLLLILLVAFPTIADAPKATEELWNDFAGQAKVWAELYSARLPDAYDVKEAWAWKITKEKWDIVRKRIDQEHQ